jgi:hypothetical protein
VGHLDTVEGMSIVQRRALGVVGAFVALVVIVLVLTRGGGRDGTDRLEVGGASQTAPTTVAGDGTDQPDTGTTDTTLPLVPVTTGIPVPDATEAPPPTRPPSATPAAPGSATGPTIAGGAPSGSSVVDGKGAVLARPADTTTTRPVDKAKGCNSANDPGWTVAECGALRSGGTVLLWVVETKGKATRVLALKEQTAGRWVTVLSAADDAGTAWSKVGVRGEDLSGDGQPELTFGFHRRSSDKVLAVDVVDAASASVVVHRDLPHGIVQTAKGSLTTWAAAGDGYDQVTIRYAGGAWRATAPQRVDRGAAPQASSV